VYRACTLDAPKRGLRFCQVESTNISSLKPSNDPLTRFLAEYCTCKVAAIIKAEFLAGGEG
jgi:hypothetical protein